MLPETYRTKSKMGV